MGKRQWTVTRFYPTKSKVATITETSVGFDVTPDKGMAAEIAKQLGHYYSRSQSEDPHADAIVRLGSSLAGSFDTKRTR